MCIRDRYTSRPLPHLQEAGLLAGEPAGAALQTLLFRRGDSYPRLVFGPHIRGEPRLRPHPLLGYRRYVSAASHRHGGGRLLLEAASACRAAGAAVSSPGLIGRLAQGESASLTRKRPLVQIQY